jgi:hypothetical protein
VLDDLTPDVSYNNNKISNKTNFMEEEPFGGSPSDQKSLERRADLVLKDIDI